MTSLKLPPQTAETTALGTNADRLGQGLGPVIDTAFDVFSEDMDNPVPSYGIAVSDATAERMIATGMARRVETIEATPEFTKLLESLVPNKIELMIPVNGKVRF